MSAFDSIKFFTFPSSCKKKKGKIQEGFQKWWSKKTGLMPRKDKTEQERTLRPRELIPLIQKLVQASWQPKQKERNDNTVLFLLSEKESLERGDRR